MFMTKPSVSLCLEQLFTESLAIVSSALYDPFYQLVYAIFTSANRWIHFITQQSHSLLLRRYSVIKRTD